jgi:hypothetical protein
MVPTYKTAALVFFALLAWPVISCPARAEMGPCQPDPEHADSLICGRGADSARVVPDTTSPDKTLALAWRDPGYTPYSEPLSDAQLEMLLVRLADGAVLAKGDTEYWFDGERRANHQHEDALWSPNSRLAVRIHDTRYETAALVAFVIGADGKLAGQAELLKLAEPAVRKRIKRGGGSVFVLAGDARTLGNDGTLRFKASVFTPKVDDDEADFTVTMKLTPGKAGLRARIVSIKPVKR